MKTLSVRQPWAWLIVQGYKDVENRSWPTSYRGPLLIHASKTLDRTALDWLHDEAAQYGVTLPESFPTGGIVGQVNLVDCVTQSDSDWFDGPYGFVLDDAHPLPFRPCPGKLGFFDS